MPEVAGRVVDAFEARVRELEDAGLSPLAVASYASRGREHAEEPCAVRTPFQRDRDRIVHSRPFRRLKGRTQVFIDPAGRPLPHADDPYARAATVSRVVARALALNEDLTEAIGLATTEPQPFGTRARGRFDGALARARAPGRRLASLPHRARGASRGT